MHTLTAVDLYGEPFTNITFVLPKEAVDPWSYAATAEATAAFEQPDDHTWSTVFTGASTVRDVLIGQRPNLHVLRDLHATAKALGGVENVAEIVAALPSVFLLRDTADGLWDIATRRPLSPTETRGVLERYDEILEINANAEFVATMHGHWAQLEEEAVRQQAVHGYALDDLLSPAGTLDLSRLADAMERADSAEVQPAAFIDYGRQCFLFICSHRFTGNISQANQATQGGGAQERGSYSLPTPPSRFQFHRVRYEHSRNRHGVPRLRTIGLHWTRGRAVQEPRRHVQPEEQYEHHTTGLSSVDGRPHRRQRPPAHR